MHVSEGVLQGGKLELARNSHTNVAFDWTYHFLTCEKTLFAILIGCGFFYM